MRKEFLYWYPIDERVVTKYLLPNHIVYMIFHHADLLHHSEWPLGVRALPKMFIEGMKDKDNSSSSPIDNFIKLFPSDAIRAAMLSTQKVFKLVDTVSFPINYAAEIDGVLFRELAWIESVLRPKKMLTEKLNATLFTSDAQSSIMTHTSFTEKGKWKWNCLF